MKRKRKKGKKKDRGERRTESVKRFIPPEGMPGLLRLMFMGLPLTTVPFVISRYAHDGRD